MRELGIYIAGKISGLSEEVVRKKFGFSEMVLYSRCYIPISPLRLCSDIDKDDWTTCMEVCLNTLFEADGVLFQGDWEESPGARIEHCVANIIKHYRPDFRIMYEEDFGND